MGGGNKANASDQEDDMTQTTTTTAAQILGSIGGKRNTPAQQAARKARTGRPRSFRASYRSSAKVRDSREFGVALGQAAELRREVEPGAKRSQIVDTIDGLVGRRMASGRMAWPAEILAASRL